MKRSIVVYVILILCVKLSAQVELSYQVPPREILELADAPVPPTVMVNDKGTQVVLLHRNRFMSLAELSEPELKLAGLRINPVSSNESRGMNFFSITLLKTGERTEIQVSGLPEKPLLSNFLWSPDQTFLAFTNSVSTTLELWILDMQTYQCRKVASGLNGTTGKPFDWYKNSKNLLVKMVPASRKPLIDKTLAVPTGPQVSESEGKKAQNRTYQDLLKDKTDEFNFEQLVTSEIYSIAVTGEKTLWKTTGMYSGLNFSPDGNYVIVTEIKRPFSYLVPLDRFPSVTTVCDIRGNEIKVLLHAPLVEDLPQGFMAVEKGIRNIGWRKDKPSSIVYVVALDEGDPQKKTEFRDEVFQLDAPFTSVPKSLVKTPQRFLGILWCNDQLAIVRDNWRNTRNSKTYLFDPSDSSQKPELLFDTNTEDNYSLPGSFVTLKNGFGENVLAIENNKLFLSGPGYSPEGIRPFYRQLDLKTRKITEIWRADGKFNLEQIVDIIEPFSGILLTRIESQKDFPNYFIRNCKKKTLPVQVTYFENPFKPLENVYREVIRYRRQDGVELSGTLYLPAGYDRSKKEKLPLVMWAYPVEFKDAASAGQITTSPHSFISPNYGSPVFWVARGYAILDNAAFPIIGEGKNEPNDTFIEQLVSNAKAAIDAVDSMGYIDRKKVAVGGHSYGAFMTANLLTHSDLFAAGIARSGAYNRSLTPFGFQSEERNFWEAPQVYNAMSPFMHADKMKSALLLIHGEADNNSGTFPIQSERYFNALKGLGANVRLVILPKESHGYAARESILHMLWEQDQWLDRWLKKQGSNR